MLVLSAATAFAVVVSILLYVLAAQGMPVTPPPVVRQPIAIERPVRASEPILEAIRCVPGPVWCPKASRWRDPVTKRFTKGPTNAQF